MDKSRIESILSERLKALGDKAFGELLGSRNIKSRSRFSSNKKSRKRKGCVMVADPRTPFSLLGVPKKLAERILILGHFA